MNKIYYILKSLYEKNLERQLKYFSYLTHHKWYVMVECFRMGIVWRGLTHDLDKFRPRSFFAYAKFFGKRSIRDENGHYNPTGTGDPAFEYAWFKHTRKSRHHRQYWCLAIDGQEELIKMDKNSIKEMICDWIGTFKAQRNNMNVLEWWNGNKNKIKLHDETIIEIEDYLTELKK